MTRGAAKGVAYGEQLKAARERKKLTQEGLIKLVRISRRHLLRIENEGETPSVGLSVRFADALDEPSLVLPPKPRRPSPLRELEATISQVAEVVDRLEGGQAELERRLGALEESTGARRSV